MDATLLTSAGSEPSSAYALVQALTVLALMSGLTFAAFRFVARGGVGLSKGRAIQVEERLALDTKNALVVVRVDQRRMLLAVSAAGPVQLLSELSPGHPEPQGEVGS